MKKLNIFSAICMMCLMLVSALSFTACDEDNQLDTNQFQGGVSLNVYGPSPVARGGELRFIGSGLNQVTSVSIPGCADITNITVINNGEIRVTVPQDAQPGKVVLHSPKGDITTITPLTFTEPVGFEAAPFSPATVKFGQKLTITGEYLNLVTAIQFADEVVIEQKDFIEHTRKAISLVVPEEAQTGKVALVFCATGDTIPNTIYSEAELNVVLPSVKSVKDINGSKPGQTIEIGGDNFDLIKKVVMPNDAEVEFKVADGKLTFVLPADITAGYIRVVPASGVEVIVANNGVAEPTVEKAVPATEVREGDVIVITGKNLDVVTGIEFPTSGGSVTAQLEEGATAENISVKVPAGAISGDIKLLNGFGGTFTVRIQTAKPALKEYSPSPVSAGSELTISGSNLDLVSSVTFAEGLKVETFNAQSATELKVIVPVAAVTGAVTVTMTNGETVEFASLDIDSPVFCFIPEMPGEDAEIKASSVMTLDVVNGDKLTGVQIDGQDCQFILNNGSILYVNVPENAGKKSVIKLISSNGEVEYPFAFIPNTEQSFVIWSGLFDLGSWSNNWEFGKADNENRDAFKQIELQAGDELVVHITPLADDWCVKFNNGHWGAITLPGFEALSDPAAVNAGNYKQCTGLDFDGRIVIKVNDEIADMLTNDSFLDWGASIIFNGTKAIINKMEVKRHISLETTLWTGEAVADDWGNQPTFLSDGGAELLEAGAKVGSVIRMYLKPTEANWKVQVVEGHWGPTYTSVCSFGENTEEGKFTEYDLDANGGCVAITLTQEMLDAALEVKYWGGVLLLNGDNIICTKVTIE